MIFEPDEAKTRYYKLIIILTVNNNKNNNDTKYFTDEMLSRI